jgi:SAM-dependent methyltransferase
MRSRPGREVDFGIAAGDYARHRPGFPPAFFERVRPLGIGLAGQRVLDLGAGTGTLARGFANQGCSSIGVDPSAEMLAAATAMAGVDEVPPRLVRGVAEALGFRDGVFDVVCAGQCWHWFERGRAAAEANRVLRPGGWMLIGYFTYLSDPGTLGAETDDLVLRHHPDWPLAHKDGRFPQYVADLTGVGMRHLETFEFDVELAFTHESWRGRFRSCNGVFTLPREVAARFDAELAALLAERHPEPLRVGHRVFGIVATKPASGRRAPPGFGAEFAAFG